MVLVRRGWLSRLGDSFETGGLLLWILVCVVSLVFLISSGISGYRKNQELERTMAELQAQIRDLEGQNDLLRREKDALANDPAYLERIMRKELRMGREGERVIRED